ncbi:unnamed protein product [Amoebophrya sp. A120]|nr:unnamed protein product [Amoebophrya sp. A120]|eukprot:GSA120T00021206001.1
MRLHAWRGRLPLFCSSTLLHFVAPPPCCPFVAALSVLSSLGTQQPDDDEATSGNPSPANAEKDAGKTTIPVGTTTSAAEDQHPDQKLATPSTRTEAAQDHSDSLSAAAPGNKPISPTSGLDFSEEISEELRTKLQLRRQRADDGSAGGGETDTSTTSNLGFGEAVLAASKKKEELSDELKRMLEKRKACMGENTAVGSASAGENAVEQHQLPIPKVPNPGYNSGRAPSKEQGSNSCSVAPATGGGPPSSTATKATSSRRLKVDQLGMMTSADGASGRDEESSTWTSEGRDGAGTLSRPTRGGGSASAMDVVDPEQRSSSGRAIGGEGSLGTGCVDAAKEIFVVEETSTKTMTTAGGASEASPKVDRSCTTGETTTDLPEGHHDPNLPSTPSPLKTLHNSLLEPTLPAYQAFQQTPSSQFIKAAASSKPNLKAVPRSSSASRIGGLAKTSKWISNVLNKNFDTLDIERRLNSLGLHDLSLIGGAGGGRATTSSAASATRSSTKNSRSRRSSGAADEVSTTSSSTSRLQNLLPGEQIQLTVDATYPDYVSRELREMKKRKAAGYSCTNYQPGDEFFAGEELDFVHLQVLPRRRRRHSTCGSTTSGGRMSVDGCGSSGGSSSPSGGNEDESSPPAESSAGDAAGGRPAILTTPSSPAGCSTGRGSVDNGITGIMGHESDQLDTTSSSTSSLNDLPTPKEEIQLLQQLRKKEITRRREDLEQAENAFTEGHINCRTIVDHILRKRERFSDLRLEFLDAEIKERKEFQESSAFSKKMKENDCAESAVDRSPSPEVSFVIVSPNSSGKNGGCRGEINSVQLGAAAHDAMKQGPLQELLTTGIGSSSSPSYKPVPMDETTDTGRSCAGTAGTRTTPTATPASPSSASTSQPLLQLRSPSASTGNIMNTKLVSATSTSPTSTPSCTATGSTEQALQPGGSSAAGGSTGSCSSELEAKLQKMRDRIVDDDAGLTSATAQHDHPVSVQQGGPAVLQKDATNRSVPQGHGGVNREDSDNKHNQKQREQGAEAELGGKGLFLI